MLKLAPLEAVKRASNEFPGIWDTIEWVKGKGIEFGYKWDESICRYPIAYGIAALEKLGAPAVVATSVGCLYSALAMWRREKRVYRYDLDLLREVVNTADDLVIPIEILYRMPAQCVFVEYPETGFDVAGFLAWIECDVERNSQELRLIHLDYDARMINQSIVHLKKGGTINEGIDGAKRRMLDNASAFKGINIALNWIEQARQITIESVQLLLYICAENADIQENAEQKKIYKPGQKVSDKPREVRKWDVGENLGEQIRIIKTRKFQSSSNDSVKCLEAENEDPERIQKSSRKYKNRPHMRRAHWHHYWVGEGRKNLVLKWINSMFINAEDGEVGVTIQMVDKHN